MRLGELPIGRSRCGADVAERVPALDQHQSTLTLVEQRDVGRATWFGGTSRQLEPALKSGGAAEPQNELLDREVPSVRRIFEPIAHEFGTKWTPERFRKREPDGQWRAVAPSSFKVGQTRATDANALRQGRLRHAATTTADRYIATGATASLVCGAVAGNPPLRSPGCRHVGEVDKSGLAAAYRAHVRAFPRRSQHGRVGAPRARPAVCRIWNALSRYYVRRVSDVDIRDLKDARDEGYASVAVTGTVPQAATW